MKLSNRTVSLLRWSTRIRDRADISKNGILSVSNKRGSTHFYAKLEERLPFDCAIRSVRVLLKLLDSKTDVSFPEADRIRLQQGRGSITIALKSQDGFHSVPRAFPLVDRHHTFLHSEDLSQIRQIRYPNSIVELHGAPSALGARVICYTADNDLELSFVPRFPALWTHEEPLIFKLRNLLLQNGSYKITRETFGRTIFSWAHGPVVLVLTHSPGLRRAQPL